MNGEKLLLDTNAFIYFFEGRSSITELVLQTPTICYSPISEIELLSAPHLSPEETEQITNFLNLCQRVELTSEVINRTISVRRQYRFKTPDAIIIATALHLNVPIASADKAFDKVDGIVLISDILQ